MKKTTIPKNVEKTISVILLLALFSALVIFPGCQKTYSDDTPEQEINVLLDKWYNAFKKNDYASQWDLLSADSPLRTSFTARFTYPADMSQEEKNKDAFIKVSRESFSPLKRYELYSLVIKKDKANAFVITHWAGYLNDKSKYVRPMRKRGTLELVKENGKWLVFNRQEGYKELKIKTKTGALEELLSTKDIQGASVTDINFSPDKTCLFFLTDSGAAGFLKLTSKKICFLPPEEGQRPPVFAGKDIDVRVLACGPLSDLIALSYCPSSSSNESVLCVFDKTAKLVLRTKIPQKLGQAFFSSSGDSIVLSLIEPDGSISRLIKVELDSGEQSELWSNNDVSQTLGNIEAIFGVYRDKLALSVNAADAKENHRLGTIDLTDGEFEDLSGKWPITPGVEILAHSMAGHRLVLMTATREPGTSTIEPHWRNLKLKFFNLMNGKTRKVVFLPELATRLDVGTAGSANPVKSFVLSPSRSRILFSFSEGDTDVLMLDSLRFREFQVIYPRGWDQENTRVPNVPESTAIIDRFDWSPGKDNVLFLVSPNRLFISTKDFVWKPAEVKILRGHVDGPALWQTDTRIIFVGRKTIKEAASESSPKGIYALDVSLE